VVAVLLLVATIAASFLDMSKGVYHEFDTDAA
jgi:hypothetical protein